MNNQHVMMDIPIRQLPEIPPLHPGKTLKRINVQPVLLFLSLIAAWLITPEWLRQIDGTTGAVDQGIWLLILLSFICFLLIICLCWWLFMHSWQRLGLPPIHKIVSQFNNLNSWQQLKLFLASFALVLLALLGSFIAVI